jgi:hypothetical protein
MRAVRCKQLRQTQQSRCFGSASRSVHCRPERCAQRGCSTSLQHTQNKTLTLYNLDPAVSGVTVVHAVPEVNVRSRFFVCLPS